MVAVQERNAKPISYRKHKRGPRWPALGANHLARDKSVATELAQQVTLGVDHIDDQRHLAQSMG
jgi:hypothetical protein